MTRLMDIKELLSGVDELLLSLSKAYEAARHDDTVVAIPRLGVKSSLEHLRSALDFAAGDIHRKAFGKEGRSYFPYGEDKAAFEKSLKNNFPKLDVVSPDLFNSVLSIQKHIINNSWLYDLAKLANLNKHNSLSEQIKDHFPDTLHFGKLATMVNGGIVEFNNCRVGGRLLGAGNRVILRSDMSDQQIQSQINPELDLPIKRTGGEIKFFLDGTKLDALDFLTMVRFRVGAYIDELYKLI